MRKPKVEFTKAIADEICDQISLGKPIQQILDKPGMPTWMTVTRHLRTNDTFREQYELARVQQADYLADQMLSYVEKAAADPKGANGYKVAAEILRWQAMVRSPRKYSDRLIQENQTTPPAAQETIIKEIQQLQKELGIVVVSTES